jgi:hypothetical protein
MNSQTALSLEQATVYILTLDFNPIINKLVNYLGWSRSHALEVCTMYRRFLILHKKYGQQYTLPPSEDIDEFWHMHILDTKRYRIDCETIFGYYLDHYPYLGIDETTNFKDLEKAFTEAQKLYAQEFNGELILEVRGTWAKILAFCRFLWIQRPKRTGSSYANKVVALKV